LCGDEARRNYDSGSEGTGKAKIFTHTLIKNCTTINVLLRSGSYFGFGLFLLAKSDFGNMRIKAPLHFE
jgi:hypothetical protein